MAGGRETCTRYLCSIFDLFWICVSLSHSFCLCLSVSLTSMVSMHSLYIKYSPPPLLTTSPVHHHIPTDPPPPPLSLKKYVNPPSLSLSLSKAIHILYRYSIAPPRAYRRRGVSGSGNKLQRKKRNHSPGASRVVSALVIRPLYFGGWIRICIIFLGKYYYPVSVPGFVSASNYFSHSVSISLTHTHIQEAGLGTLVLYLTGDVLLNLDTKQLIVTPCPSLSLTHSQPFR